MTEREVDLAGVLLDLCHMMGLSDVRWNDVKEPTPDLGQRMLERAEEIRSFPEKAAQLRDGLDRCKDSCGKGDMTDDEFIAWARDRIEAADRAMLDPCYRANELPI